MNDLYDQAEIRMVRLFNRYMELSKKQREYCPGVVLYPSEIHAIERIATINSINLTELAINLNLTKGAVSKSVVKLERKGLIRRYQYINNRREIYFELTELGRQAYEGHKQYHMEMTREINRFCETISDKQGNCILNYLDVYLKQMERLDYRM
ncbi:MAG: MarR family transcriptional regulator [Clostridiales bacterium]|nr:MarR family transcriptional regulator [Clostridiales bacterium]